MNYDFFFDAQVNCRFWKEGTKMGLMQNKIFFKFYLIVNQNVRIQKYLNSMNSSIVHPFL